MTDGMTIQVFTGVDRPVVVKTATTPAARASLARETERLRRAKHPGVVEVVSASTERLEIAWVGAHTLETARLPVPAAAGVLAAVAETIADLHALGVIHGRLEPGHVVIAGDGRPVICGMSGPDPSDELTGPADDVAAIGRLIDHLLGPDAEPEPIPDRRWGRKTWTGYHRRTLQLLADRASHDDPARRPTARAVANAIVEAVPEARLVPSIPAGSTPATEPAAIIEVADGPPPPGDGAASVQAHEPGAFEASTDETALVDPILFAPDEGPTRREVLDTIDHPHPGRAPRVGSDRPGHVRAHVDGREDRVLGLRVDGAGTQPPIRPPERTSLSYPSPRDGRRVLRSLVAAACLLGLIGVARSVVTSGRAGLVGSEPVAARPDATPAPAGSAPSSVPQPDGTVGPPGDGPTRDADRPIPAVDDTADPPGPPEVVRAGTTYAVGEPGDHVQVADWDCDGEATPGVVRPETGEVFLFDGWATDGEPLVNEPTAVVPGAQTLIPPPPDDGCRPAIRLRSGQVVPVPATVVPATRSTAGARP